MLTTAQKKAAQGIVTVFETGRVGSKKSYSTVTLLKGDTGGLTYGLHQTTINSGNLYLLIKAYTEDSNADYANEFKPYLPLLASKSPSLARDSDFKELLKKAGEDRDMQETQDAFFDRVYWNPAVDMADNFGFKRALAVAIVYDSFIHGSWKLIKTRTDKAVGNAHNAGEITWIRAYNSQRRSWLANHSNALLRKCVYRQDAFNVLLNGSNWDLNLPLMVRGIRLTTENLGVTNDEPVPTEDVVADVTAEEENDRLLYWVHDGRMQGEDVLELQTALKTKGYYQGKLDGDFGEKTDKAVRDFQKRMGIRVDGIAGRITKLKLGIE